jgi:hypothetical protein
MVRPDWLFIGCPKYSLAVASAQLSVNVASASQSKLGASKSGFGLLRSLFADVEFGINARAVELQRRKNANAQPFGFAQTLEYAILRIAAMRKTYGSADFNLAVESGAMGYGGDAAVLVIETRDGRRLISSSTSISFPILLDASGRRIRPLEIAAARGFGDTTAGQIIHELRPHIAAHDWHRRFSSYDREAQILTAFKQAQRELAELVQGTLQGASRMPLPPRGATPLRVAWRVATEGERHGELMVLSMDGSAAPIRFGRHSGHSFETFVDGATRDGDVWIEMFNGAFVGPQHGELDPRWLYVSDVVAANVGRENSDLTAFRLRLMQLDRARFYEAPWTHLLGEPLGGWERFKWKDTDLRSMAFQAIRARNADRATRWNARGEQVLEVARHLLEHDDFLSDNRDALLTVARGAAGLEPFEAIARSACAALDGATSAAARAARSYLSTDQYQVAAVEEIIGAMALMVERAFGDTSVQTTMTPAPGLIQQNIAKCMPPSVVRKLNDRFRLDQTAALALWTSERSWDRHTRAELRSALSCMDGPSGGRIVDILQRLISEHGVAVDGALGDTVDRMRMGEGTVRSSEYVGEFRRALRIIEPGLIAEEASTRQWSSESPTGIYAELP